MSVRKFTAGMFILAVSPMFGAAITFSGSGATAADVTAVRDSFRTAIGGGTVAAPNQSFGGIRREINWDGVPDALSAPNNLPANFFNSNSPRGVVFSGGTGFQVSANSGVAPIQFDNLLAGYSSNFEPFSAQRLFTALGSTAFDVSFFLAGTSTAATTNAFGVMFSDVDLATSTSLEFFDSNNNSLGKFFAPAGGGTAGNQSFSFLGIQFNAGERVSRVRVTSGNVVLGSGADSPSTGADAVAMDDFIYAEPSAVPEPGTLWLIASGGAALALWRRWRS